MKKIINGKMYCTESAKLVGTYYSSYARNDFHYFEEKLYQKRTGEFFLYGLGNAASKYSKSCGMNEWCGSEKIIPLSYEAAQKWAEEKLDADDYIKIFGEPEESNDYTTINFRVPYTIAEYLKKEASKRNITQTELLIKWIREGK